MVTTTTTTSPVEDSTVVPKIPDLNLLQFKFTFLHGATLQEKNQAKETLWNEIHKHHMAPFYIHLCEECKLPLDNAMLTALESVNREEIEKLQAKIEDAEKNSGETEISEALISKADYLGKIGEKQKAITAYNEAFEKTPGVGAKIDLVFSMLRIGFFFSDRQIITQYLEKSKSLIEQGGDWDRRNRCKVYEALFLMSQRDFKSASTFFLETLATFTSTELMSHKDFVFYTVISCVLTLSRTEMKKQ
ncbi:26S proteasome non-ATPase regulatory subunit 6, partial [Coelomomyces lativittatus]